MSGPDKYIGLLAYCLCSPLEYKLHGGRGGWAFHSCMVESPKPRTVPEMEQALNSELMNE